MRKEDNISVCFETGKFFSRLGSLTWKVPPSLNVQIAFAKASPAVNTAHYEMEVASACHSPQFVQKQP